MSLVLQSSGGGSVTLQEPATASNRTLSLPDVTGTVAHVVSNVLPAYDGSALTGITTGGMTLLGTVNTTSGNSVSLGSVNLSSYRLLHIVLNGVSTNGASAVVYFTGDNTQAGISVTLATAATSYYHSLLVDLTVGRVVNDTAVYGATSTLNTSATTIYARCGSTVVFDAGSISYYGVK